MDMQKSSVRRSALVLFLTALTIRWAYVAITYAVFGEEGLKIGDSHRYLTIARAFAEAIAADGVAGWGWLGQSETLMPLFTWLLTLHVSLAGGGAALSFVLAQGAFDAGTCLAVFGLASAIDRRIALWSGYAAAVAPTLIVLSGIVYTDTIFVFFSTLALWGAVAWLRSPTWRWALLIGCSLGCAALVRVWIVPWVAPLLIVMALAAAVSRRFRVREILQVASIAIILAAAITPVAWRNASTFGTWSLSPQSGVHLALWVVPLVREAKDGTPMSQTAAAIEARRAARYGAERSRNPLQISDQYTALALEELRQLGLGALARAWLVGAAINLASPAVTVVPAVAALPRTGFYDTPGRNTFEKLDNFLFRSDNALYAWLLIGGLAGLLVFRVIQLVGLVILLGARGAFWPLVLLVGFVLYVLAICGPIASPKYRLPAEPVLAVFAGAALSRFAARLRARRASS